MKGYLTQYLLDSLNFLRFKTVNQHLKAYFGTGFVSK